MALVHYVENPDMLLQNMQRGLPFAEAICGRPARKKALTIHPLMVSCPGCAQILNDVVEQGQHAQLDAPSELPAELPEELPQEPPKPLDLSDFLQPLLSLEVPGRCMEDEEFIFNWGETNEFMAQLDKEFIKGVADFAQLLGRKGLANQLWSVLFRSIARGLDIGQAVGLLHANVKTISTSVDSGACDSALQNMQTEEAQGKNRKGVMDALERRILITQEVEGEE
jgi:hypothetical protein|tara:strand:+ start:494 stop:1168 length:675 start_codon:yes stop_codon:yes gene_type:complete